MTKNNETKYTLKVKDTGELLRMKLTGEPFVYSTKALAQQGKRSLEKDREVSLVIVPA